MTIQIELNPDEERALRERAQLSGRDLAGYVHQVLQSHIRTPVEARQAEGAIEAKSIPEDLIDHEFIAYCAREADENVTLEQVLEATSKIEDSMARVVIEEERAERF
jgi:hypothetical protein